MSKIRITLARPSFDEREMEAVQRVLATGWVIQGPEVEAFEKAIATLHQVKHCVAVSSGTAALHISFLAIDIGPGDLVFLPSFAWPSAANMTTMVGARPVFVDVQPDTYNIDTDDLLKKIDYHLKNKTGTPKAIVPVHEFGLAADMEAIAIIASEYHMDIIEDAACALGATYQDWPVGNLSRLCIFSFHPRKAITTGEGGAIVTNDDFLAEQCRMWRNHGQVFQNGQRDFQVAGTNYRMTDIQAAIGRVQLSKLPESLKIRKKIASCYLSELSECRGISLPANHPEHTWQTFMIVLEEDKERASVIKKLAEYGFGAGAGSIAGHCLAVYRKQLTYKPKDLPVSAKLNLQGLALPLDPLMELSDIKQLASLLHEAR